MSPGPVTIELTPWSTPPLNLNDRDDRFTHARKVAQVRRDGGWLVRASRIGRGHAFVTVELRYQPKRRGRHDTDNLTATLKPLCDGMVDVGVVPDDTPAYMAKLEPVIVAPERGQRRGRLWLIITPGQPPAP